MYLKIKQLADEALALQNKGRMDAALREISALCAESGQVQLAEMTAEPFEEFKADMASLDSEFEAEKALLPSVVTGEFIDKEGSVVSVVERVGKKGGKK
jgi:hypothetical protein